MGIFVGKAASKGSHPQGAQNYTDSLFRALGLCALWSIVMLY